jgi:hypothetical protein
VRTVLVSIGQAENWISRASARKVLSAVTASGSAELLLDFAAVRSIGPAFADEIFRVFAQAHPKVEPITINANEQVTGMIRRAQTAKAE